jgi:hypothetical protein
MTGATIRLRKRATVRIRSNAWLTTWCIISPTEGGDLGIKSRKRGKLRKIVQNNNLKGIFKILLKNQI